MERIDDIAVMEAIVAINKRLDRIESVRQLPQDATIKAIVDSVNTVSNSLKRNRWQHYIILH